MVAKFHYGPEDRQRLLDKINRIAENIADNSGEPSSPPAAGDERDSAELPS